MGFIRDFFMGYSHGSSQARDRRIEQKVDELSSKVDSLKHDGKSRSSTNSQASIAEGSEGYKLYQRCYNAWRKDGLSHEAAVQKACLEKAIYDHNKDCQIDEKNISSHEDVNLKASRRILKGDNIESVLADYGLAYHSQWKEAVARIYKGENVRNVLSSYGFI